MATIACSRLCLPSLLINSPSSMYPSPCGVSLSLRRRGSLIATHFGCTRGTAPRPSSISHASASTVPDAIPIPEQQQDTATATIISFLLFIAFLGLSALTIGVIYIAVTDFLQKREGEKFQKEEAEKKKKGGGKKRQTMKARAAGPKGFGQKIDEIEDDDDI